MKRCFMIKILRRASGERKITMEENKNMQNAVELDAEQLEGAAGGLRGGSNPCCWYCATPIPTRNSPSRIRVTCPRCNRKFIVVSGSIVEEEVQKK